MQQQHSLSIVVRQRHRARKRTAVTRLLTTDDKNSGTQLVSSNCCGRRRWVDEQQSDVDVRFSRQRLVDRSPISANTAVTG